MPDVKTGLSAALLIDEIRVLAEEGSDLRVQDRSEHMASSVTEGGDVASLLVFYIWRYEKLAN